MDIFDKKKLEKILRAKGLPEDLILETLREINLSSEVIINDKIKRFKNKQRILASDAKKEHIRATEVLTKAEINSLPEWVKEKINTAYIVGKSKQVIQIDDGRKYHMNNKLNHMSGAEWTFFLNSVINTRYPTTGKEAYAHSIRKIHPSPKPPQLMRDIISFFTKPGDLILDYFSGVGGTQLGASLSGQRALGIDLDAKYHEAYKEASESLGLALQPTLTGDSIKILRDGLKIKKFLGEDKFSLILIDPPYGDMLSREKTGDAVKNGDKSATPFTNHKDDLGNMTWVEFRKVFKDSLKDAIKFLKNNGHIVVFIKDLQPEDNNPNLLHADLINDISSIDNIKYLGLKIWADQGVNLYPYGYPFGYVSNQIHQYILIFKYNEPVKKQ